jgi:hypothetical protein
METVGPDRIGASRLLNEALDGMHSESELVKTFGRAAMLTAQGREVYGVNFGLISEGTNLANPFGRRVAGEFPVFARTIMIDEPRVDSSGARNGKRLNIFLGKFVGYTDNGRPFKN